MVPVNMRVIATLAAAASMVAVAGQSRAEVSFSYVTDKPIYGGPLGSTITVDVYLKETLTADSTSLLATEGGLANFGVAVNRSAVGLPSIPSAVSGATADAHDFPLFAEGNVDPDGRSGYIDGSIYLASLPPIPTDNTGGGIAPAVAGEVFLGQFNVLVGRGITTFSVRAIDLYGNWTNTGTKYYDIDLGPNGDGTPTPLFTPVNNKVTTFVVTPEPSSLSLLGAGCLGLLTRRRHSCR